MGTIAGILSHAAAGTSPNIAAMDTSTSGTNGSSSDNSATISANDFLSLLVTEMQNQDPTADTDPNEYINQLVNVNSLEQLISINQTLSTAAGGTGSTTGTAGASSAGTGSNSVTGARSAVSSLSASQDTVAADERASANRSIPQNPTAQLAFGNLSIPNTTPAAQRVAQSLGGH